MAAERIISLAIAVYGASLATILAVRQLRAERRRITVILEYVAFYERAQLVIANPGHRPITISEVGMAIWLQNQWIAVQRNSLFAAEGEQGSLPVTLGDGEHITLPLSEVVSTELLDNHMRARVSVYDIEGRVFSKFRTRHYNPKWGSYSTMRS